jgi:hypothetical protein
MEKTGYNGWTNYETWNLALWIDNEEGSQEYWRDRAREAYKDADKDADDRAGDAALTIADALKDETEQNAPEIGNGFYSDILSAAISEVNWYEIAKNWIDEVKEEIDEEEAKDAAFIQVVLAANRRRPPK